MMVMDMFGVRLRCLRKKRGYSQRKLGNDLGLSESLIGMLETGDREPRSETLSQIADYFGVTTDYLLGRVEETNAIVLEGEQIPQRFRDKGLTAIALLKEALDENGVLTPEAERELLMVIAEHRLRMAGSPRKKPTE